MSRYANDNHKPRQEPGYLGNCLHSVARVIAHGLRRQERQRATAALQVLDDRPLEDIGIARYDIHCVVPESYASEKASSVLVNSLERLPELRQAA